MEDPATPTVEHRFIVNSAEEAVRTIRQRLGENAQVTSVRKVERAGLSGLFRGTQLEVIARVPAPLGTSAGETLALPAPPVEHIPITPWDLDDAPALTPTSIVPTTAPRSQPGRELILEIPRFSAHTETPAPASGGVSRLVGLLQRTGLSELLLARLQSSPVWSRIECLPLPQALPEIVALLRQEYAAIARPPLTNRLAFIGVAGAGSTSALCKHLARCVFGLGLPAAVYRLETDRPNPIDGLAAICELWGVPLLRSEEEMPAVREGTRLYVDVPGLADGPDRGEEAKIAALLQKLAVDSRIFVLNAAYETALLKGLCRRAEILGCRHLGFTHLDELVHWGKMWEFLLHRDLSTEFYSLGPGLPGDFTEDVLEGTLGKTFS